MRYESRYNAWAGSLTTAALLERYMHHRRVKYAEVTSNATPVNVGGLGSSTAGGTQAYIINARGQWVRGTTAASAGALSGRVSVIPVGLNYLPTCYFTFQTGSSFADVRWWVGIGENASFFASDNLTGVPSVYFLATSGTANWLLTSTSATAAATPVNTGVPVTVDTRYEALLVTERLLTGGGAVIQGYIGTGGVMQGPFRIETPADIEMTPDVGLGTYMHTVLENKAAAAKQVFWSKWAVGLE